MKNERLFFLATFCYRKENFGLVVVFFWQRFAIVRRILVSLFFLYLLAPGQVVAEVIF